MNIPNSYAVKAFGPAETFYSCCTLSSFCLSPIYITMHIVPAICNCFHKHGAGNRRRNVTILPTSAKRDAKGRLKTAGGTCV